MNPPPKTMQNQTSLFQVYLRLRPTQKEGSTTSAERYLKVEDVPTAEGNHGVKLAVGRPTQITLQPPSDLRKRAVEKFAFTKVFEEDAQQLDVFEGTEISSLINGVLCEGRDGLVATLGVTGSGKSHTMLGTKTQRGMTQMALDVLFKSLSKNMRSPDNFSDLGLVASLAASDPSEAQIFSAKTFLDCVFFDPASERGRGSRAQTPLVSSRAQTPMLEVHAPVFPRRHPPQQPSAIPQVPDVSHLTIKVSSKSEHVVIVSMYEVYNDRIFDLLSPSPTPGPGNLMARQGATQRDRRRPLLFKSTEGSPDRKVVAGLRKIVCATYEEALMILETGLMERRVAGTGSNSVSSRSHGFFCLEVKKKTRGRRAGEEVWVGNTLTIVDLAGSERARVAKTAGATLAEAGKINESLMYLGQCLQMQSDFQDGSKTALVPFRQCKLTELLFSNSFPSSNQQAALHHRHLQKGVMIVTADPLGDFNATSQILRYSALAREVTVPRIPSVTSAILSSSSSARGQLTSGRTTPHTPSTEDLEEAVQEIARITNDYEELAVKLAEADIARAEAELKLRAFEEKCLFIEQEVREECWAEMDERMEKERRRWQLAWDEQTGRNEEHLDKKIELVSRGIKIYEDPEPSSDERIQDLEWENDMLHSKIKALERELSLRSPTKKTKTNKIIQARDSVFEGGLVSGGNDVENVLRKMPHATFEDNPIPPSPTLKSQGKPRKMTTRKRDLGPEDEL